MTRTRVDTQLAWPLWFWLGVVLAAIFYIFPQIWTLRVVSKAGSFFSSAPKWLILELNGVPSVQVASQKTATGPTARAPRASNHRLLFRWKWKQIWRGMNACLELFLVSLIVSLCPNRK